MREVWTLSWKLLLISVVAALLLGLTNYVTKQPIADQIEMKIAAARREVLPDSDEFEEIDADALRTASEWKQEYETIQGVYKALNGAGYVINMSVSGYGGPIQLIIGIESSGTLGGVKVGEHSETAGLGAHAAEDAFQGQFAGKSRFPLEVVKNAPARESEIHAITGATATSDHVVEGVNVAKEFFDRLLNGGEVEE